MFMGNNMEGQSTYAEQIKMEVWSQYTYHYTFEVYTDENSPPILTHKDTFAINDSCIKTSDYSTEEKYMNEQYSSFYTGDSYTYL